MTSSVMDAWALDRAVAAGVTTTVNPYPFDRVDDALADLAADRVCGAAVITTT